MDMLDVHEQHLYRKIKLNHRQSTVHSAYEVLFPSYECASKIYQIAIQWNWLHMAVDDAAFRQEMEVFHNKCRRTNPSQAAETSWLGLYFAYLTVR